MIMIATIESQFNKSPVHFNTSPAILLDPERKSVRVEEFEQKLMASLSIPSCNQILSITAKTAEGMGEAEKETWQSLPHSSFESTSHLL
jgi:hypothetical protein